MNTTTKIAFIGLGNMGAPMASNLLAAGYNVKVYDLVADAMQQLAQAGAEVASSAADCVVGADVVISMLPAGKHVVDLYLGTGKVLDNLKQGALIIDSSTIDADSVKQVATAAQAKGIDCIDAPVSGGITGAKAATLSFMCGGTEVAFQKVEPLLQAMGKNIFYAGKSGSGQVAKMCNNMLLSVIMIGTSEAIKLGIANDMNPQVLSTIMQASTGRNWTLETYNPCPGVMENSPSSNDFKPGFMVDLMCKDLGLAHENSDSHQLNAQLSKLAKQIFDNHQQAGNGQLDFTSVFNAEYEEK